MIGTMTTVAICLAVIGCDEPMHVQLTGHSQDLGMLNLGDPIEAEFVVRNPYDKPIELETLELGCVCLRSDFRPQQLAGGKEYTFHVRVDDKLVLGTRSQVGILNAHVGKKIAIPFQFRYVVNAENQLFPNPNYLGFLTQAELLKGVQVDLSLKDGEDNDLDVIVRETMVVAYSSPPSKRRAKRREG